MTALLTAFYMFRLWYLTFFGETRSHDAHPHESPWSMLTPLILLGVLSLAGGWIGIPKALWGGDQFAHFLDPVVTVATQAIPAGTENQERIFSLHLRGHGGRSAGFLPICSTAASLAWPISWSSAPVVFTDLLVNKYWIDQIYTAVIVAPLLFITRYLLWGVADRGIVNGGASLAAGGVRGVGALVQRVQSGNIRSYAGWLAIGAAALLLITYFGFSMQL